MERTSPLSAYDILFSHAGMFECFFCIDGDEGVDHGVVILDTLQTLAHQFDWGYLSRLNQGRHFREALKRDAPVILHSDSLTRVALIAKQSDRRRNILIERLITDYHLAVDLSSLLRPYIENLTTAQLDQVSTYIDILLRWNAKMNLTAVREREQIVTRHFGESFFLARRLSEEGALGRGTGNKVVVDVGSGAGFPGVPLKIACPNITLTLVEAQQRKTVFLKEVLRALHLDVEVKNVRAEDMVRAHRGFADIVTLRAVEKFEVILPIASQLARSEGKLALLIGREQVTSAEKMLPNWRFGPLLAIPGSENRVIALGNQVG